MGDSTSGRGGTLARRWLAALIVAGAALASGAAVAVAGAGGTGTVGQAAPSRAALMHAAAMEFAVPEGVLLSVSYNESRWENHRGQPSADGGYGLLHLTAAVTAVPSGRGRDGDVRTVDLAAPPTLERASQLLGVAPAVLERDDRQNIRGGAAVLAEFARELDGGQLPAAAGDWYAAVARYSGASTTATARLFADDVFATIRAGVRLVTTDGQAMELAADPGVVPRREQVNALPPHTQTTAGTGQTRTATAGPVAVAAGTDVECPAEVSCSFVPAAYAQNNPGDPGDYGNFDTADRPASMAVQYIVIHDTEGSYASAISLFQNPRAAVSAHYVIRSADGAITQMVHTKDVAWHAGNWWVNSHSIGIEHEGIAVNGASWYTEAMYRSSAALVRYLAARYHVPLDRAHIIGHDNVVGPTPEFVAGMHWDPGPYWDWGHYMQLVTRPIRSAARPSGALVTIDPKFLANPQVVTDCSSGTCVTLPTQGTNFVYLRTRPSDSAPLLSDPAIHTNGAPGTTVASDWSAKAVSGQQFARYARQGEWVGIWFGGQVGWFRDPLHQRTVTPSCGQVVSPRSGLTSIPVYGRAYPEASAYGGTGVGVQAVVALQYTIGAGQQYVAIGPLTPDYYAAVTFNGVNTLVTGQDRYYEISFNHRIAFLRAADVTLTRVC